MPTPIRDERWEYVYASVAPLRYDTYADEETNELRNNIYEFRVEVVLGTTVYYSTQRMHKDDIELSYASIYKMILDAIVKSVDDYIEEGTGIVVNENLSDGGFICRGK